LITGAPEKLDTTSLVGAPLLTITEAAEFLNVSKATIRRWTNEGRLKCLRIGAREERRFRKTDLAEFLNHTNAEKPEHTGLAVESKAGRPAMATHRCVISNDVDEEWAALGPEILKSLDQGAQVLVIEDADRKRLLDNLLAQTGQNKRKLLASHALRCVSIEDSYFLSGTMQSDRAVAFVESAILEAKARGFQEVLVIGADSWATGLHDEVVLDELRKYELGLDEMLSRHPGATVLCPYTATQVSAQMLVQAIATHPSMQIQSTVMPGLLAHSAN
jgi:transcriptional repressor of dcmA and dcmR